MLHQWRKTRLFSVVAIVAANSSIQMALAEGRPEPGSDEASDISPQDLADIQRAVGADGQTKPKPSPGAASAVAPVAPVSSAAPGRSLLSFNPDMSLIADFALAAFSRPGLQIGGHDPKTNGFNLQALEFSALADVDPYFRFNAHVVLGAEGAEIEEVYATTLALPGSLQIRTGQFLTRFGRLNPTHPHAWDFVDQPLVLGKMLGPDGNRGLGAELSWLSPLPWYVELVLSETMASGACCARSFYGDDNQGVHGLFDLQTTLAVKQFFALSDDWSFSLGLSSALGPNAAYRGARTQLYGADVYVKYRPLSRASPTVVSLQAEGILRRRDASFGPLEDRGAYVQALWRFAQRWAFGGRYDIVSGLSEDPLDPVWTGKRWRAAADLTFFPTEFSRLRVQASHDQPTWESHSIEAAFLALEVVAGAHGAHTF